MTRLVVHRLGAERLLVSGDDGRRWVLEAACVADPGVRDALDALRARAADAVAPPGGSGTRIRCLDDLADVAATTDRPVTVRWTFAGRAHRMTLHPGTAAAAAHEAIDALVATVSDAAQAAALRRPALRDDVAGAERPLPGHTDAPLPAGVLERWEDGAWQRHRIAPPPLVDPVTGVLRHIAIRPPEPDAPPGFVHLHAELPHLSSVDPAFHPDPLAPAGAFRAAASAWDPGSPEAEAILSGIAHVCGAYLRQGALRVAAAADLRTAGERVLTVAEWAPHDPRLHDEPGFPFVRDHPDLRTAWLAGEDAHGACWAPLSLVHAGYASVGLEIPLTNGHNLVGLQAGFTEDEALDRAATHLIAQDAVARWWREGPPLPEVPLPRSVRKGWGNSPWRVHALAVPSRFAVPVRLAVVDGAGIIALGYACASSPDEAAERAVSEALVQHASARDLARPDSLIRDAAALGNGGVPGLAPHDPRRRYAAWFADRRRMIDPMCHVQYGLDPEVVASTRHRVAPAAAAGDSGEDAVTTPYRALSGTRHVRVDVTTDRVRASGAHAVRILAPSLRRLPVAAFDDPHGAATPYPGW